MKPKLNQPKSLHMVSIKFTLVRLVAIFLLATCCLLNASAQKDTTGLKKYKVDPSRKKPAGSQTTTSSTATMLPPPVGCSLFGSSSVTAGTTYVYSLSCENGSMADYWQVSCGTIIDYYGDEIDIQWNSGCTSGTVWAYGVDGSTLASKTVTITSTALMGGTISNASQTISYNTAPAQLNASLATGGTCSGSYSYQWQMASVIDGTYTDIAGATGQNYQPSALSSTTYYRRKVTCSSSVAYTNIATVNVASPLIGGYVTNPNQTIFPGSTPALVSATPAGGGNCGGVYFYQWRFSTGGAYTNISGATGQNYQPGPLTQTTYFQRVTTCNGEVAYTETNATIIVIRPLDGGCITSGNQTVVFGNIPSTITTTPAKDGNCNGNYSYQWQSSTDNNYFTNINGATSQNLSFSSSLSQTTYFQRKTTCGSEVKYTASVAVNMVAYITFYSAQKSGTFTRNNCGTGATGSSVTYTVPQNTYTSTISQPDADQKAQNDVNTNGQNYANANGTCTWYNVVKSGTFTKNNCATGGTGSSVTYSVPAARYSSTISQADADQKAINDVNTNGQSYANSNGYCTWYSDAISAYYYSQNCPAGQTPLAYYVSIAANTYSSTISKANANAQAQQDAQQQANNYGGCQAPDVTVNCDNYTGFDFIIELTNVNTGELFQFYNGGSSDILGSVPAGSYDIRIYQDYYSGYNYWFEAGCGYYASGNEGDFYSVDISEGCSNITISY